MNALVIVLTLVVLVVMVVTRHPRHAVCPVGRLEDRATPEPVCGPLKQAARHWGH